MNCAFDQVNIGAADVCDTVSTSAFGGSVQTSSASNIYYTSGFDAKQIGSQNLRSGGAVNLKITGYDRDMTKNCSETEHDTQSTINKLYDGIDVYRTFN